MTPEKFTFSSTQLNRQFPFYILLNNDLSIVAAGMSLVKLLGECCGSSFRQFFSIKRPECEIVNFEVLKAMTHQLVLIEIFNECRNTLKGEFEFLDDTCQLFFTGSLWLNSLQDLKTSTLTNHDFATHDSIVDLLHLLQIQELINDDLTELLNKVNQQKKDLKIADQENKKIAASLEESNQRFGYVSRATADAIWDWDIAKGTLYRGEGFFKLFGHSGGSNAERMDFWKEHIHPEEFDNIIFSIDNIIRSDAVNWVHEYRFLKSDGSYAYVLDKGFVLRGEDSEPLRMVGAIQDITERKQEEIRLKLLESVITNVNEGVLITQQLFPDDGAIDNAPVTAYVNQAFSKITGYSNEEVFGLTAEYLHGPDTDPETVKKIAGAVSLQLPFETSILNYRKNGEPFWMDISLHPVFDKVGNLSHWISIHRDITDRKRAEINLNEALVSMQKSNDDLEQFAYVASHDLQEPLRMVANFLSLLEKKYGDSLDSKGMEYIRYAVDGAKRMQQLILDLLEYSRVGRTEDKLEVVNLEDLMKEIISFYGHIITEKQAAVTYNSLPSLRILKAPLRQVFQNLVSNSLKYTSELVPPVIKVTATERYYDWEFAFSDNGIGIEPHHFERIFIIFQRLHTKQEFSGTGIGLAITKKIVENLGGTIRLESEFGKGTTFFLSILKKIKEHL